MGNIEILDGKYKNFHQTTSLFSKQNIVFYENCQNSGSRKCLKNVVVTGHLSERYVTGKLTKK